MVEKIINLFMVTFSFFLKPKLVNGYSLCSGEGSVPWVSCLAFRGKIKFLETYYASTKHTLSHSRIPFVYFLNSRRNSSDNILHIQHIIFRAPFDPGDNLRFL